METTRAVDVAEMKLKMKLAVVMEDDGSDGEVLALLKSIVLDAELLLAPQAAVRTEPARLTA